MANFTSKVLKVPKVPKYNPVSSYCSGSCFSSSVSPHLTPAFVFFIFDLLSKRSFSFIIELRATFGFVALFPVILCFTLSHVESKALRRLPVNSSQDLLSPLFADNLIVMASVFSNKVATISLVSLSN